MHVACEAGPLHSYSLLVARVIQICDQDSAKQFPNKLSSRDGEGSLVCNHHVNNSGQKFLRHRISIHAENSVVRD